MKRISSTLLAFLLLLTACRRQESVMPITQFVWEVMDLYYLWNDQMPRVDWRKYTDPHLLLEDLRYKPRDRWSTLYDNGPEFLAYLQSGQLKAFGFAMKWDANNQLRVAYVYANSPAARAGLQRGDIILEVNGQAPTPNTPISFTETSTLKVKKRDSGTEESITMTREVLDINPILATRVINNNGIKIGYVCFNVFLSDAAPLLNQTFNYLKNEGVQEMILDLRYNGGGDVKVAQHLGSLLAPTAAIGNVFMKQVYNQKNSANNKVRYFEEKDARLNLSRLVVITTGSTASASELIINGLRPFMEVKLVGSTTAGKNVGSAVFTHLNYAFLPIIFESRNANDESDYYNGFVPDYQSDDDLSHDFGDPQEASLAAAISYLVNGTFPGVQPRKIPQKASLWQDTPPVDVMVEVE